MAEPHLAQGQCRGEKSCENWGWLNTPTPHKGMGHGSGGHLEHPAEAAGGLVILSCVPCLPARVTGATHHCARVQSASGSKAWEGSLSYKLSLLGGCGWDSFPSCMQRIFLEIGLEFLRPGERLACLCKLPVLSRLGFSLRRHTVCSSLMARVKQEHLLMKR